MPEIRRSLVCLFVIAWATTGVACLPIPHYQQEAPALRGVARQNGEPLRGVVVRRAINITKAKKLACDAREQTRTDAEGRFRFERSRYFSPIMIFGDRMDTWAICIQLPSGARAVWEDHDWWGGPPEQLLDCEVGEKVSPGAPEELKTIGAPAPDQPGCRRHNRR